MRIPSDVPHVQTQPTPDARRKREADIYADNEPAAKRRAQDTFEIVPPSSKPRPADMVGKIGSAWNATLSERLDKRVQEAIFRPTASQKIEPGSVAESLRTAWAHFDRIILHGPGGSGKTFALRQALSEKSTATVYKLMPHDFYSKWKGESGALIQRLFTDARKRERAIICIDEADVLFRKPRGADSPPSAWMKTFVGLMQELDGLRKGVTVVLVCSEPWEMDDAILRRFRRGVALNMPESDALVRPSYVIRPGDYARHTTWANNRQL